MKHITLMRWKKNDFSDDFSRNLKIDGISPHRVWRALAPNSLRGHPTHFVVKRHIYGLTPILFFSDDGLIFCTTKDIRLGASLVQQQPDTVSKWCQETHSNLNPSKAQALWCTFNDKSAGSTMPAITFKGTDIEGTDHLKYLDIHFDRALTYRKRVEAIVLKSRKGLSVLKAMATKGI